jgi:hypothetical protein
MKLSVLFISIFTSFCFVTSSCTKTEMVKPPPTIVGFWVGTYQVTGSPTSYYISFDLRPDGVFLSKGIGADANSYYGEGTYTLTDVNFAYSFTTLNLSQAGAIQNATGTYTAATGTITGNWQNQGTTIGGTFTVTKN